MNCRMSTAQTKAAPPAPMVAVCASIAPGLYQTRDVAPPNRKARAISTFRMEAI